MPAVSSWNESSDLVGSIPLGNLIQPRLPGTSWEHSEFCLGNHHHGTLSKPDAKPRHVH